MSCCDKGRFTWQRSSLPLCRWDVRWLRPGGRRTVFLSLPSVRSPLSTCEGDKSQSSKTQLEHEYFFSLYRDNFLWRGEVMVTVVKHVSERTAQCGWR
ncbi:hypothetical protein E2C01_098704 [Portunus trituberculatus]|uniref:Uncharacterized protein n=1 Tax=Portunus trituberculatus TaxID=210409 RepID=A0A5B7KEU0_PORTR|nr:hypothetical protein [Portunus trituberculatus]